jgi:hypothetical protein
MDFRPPTSIPPTDASIIDQPYRPFYNPFHSAPILVKQSNDSDRAVFRERPWLGVLLFDNVSSDARDHAANERSTCYLQGLMREA